MTQAEKLAWDIKVTAGSRFNASKRLKVRYRRKQWFIVAFSVVLTVASALTLVFSFQEIYGKVLGLSVLASSTFVVVFSAAQIENTDIVDSHRLYLSAIELSRIRREFLALAEAQQVENIGRYASKYDEAIARHGVNHEDADFERYRLKHSWEFEDLRDKNPTQIDFRQLADIASRYIGPTSVAAALAAAAGAIISAIVSII